MPLFITTAQLYNLFSHFIGDPTIITIILSFENPIDAAKRELLEETGYESDDFIYLGSYYQDQGCSSAYNYYYIARNCKKVRSQKLDKDEFIKYILVTSDELQELFNEGYIKGLNSAYVIEKSKKYIMEW